MSTRRILICDQCGKEEIDKGHHSIPGWISVWVSSDSAQTDIDYDVCSYQCLIDKVINTDPSVKVENSSSSPSYVQFENLYGELI